MNKLIECVPNFSEGRDLDKINSIVDVMSNVDKVTILDGLHHDVDSSVLAFEIASRMCFKALSLVR